MKRTARSLFLAPIALVALVALEALALSPRYAYESQNLTRTAPAASEFDAVNDGSITGVAAGVTKALQLGGVTSFRVSVCAVSGQTLSGAGTLKAWLYDTKRGYVKRNPGLDLTVNVAAGETRCQVFPDQEAMVARAMGDKLIYASTGVTVSSGTTDSVEYSAAVEP